MLGGWEMTKWVKLFATPAWPEVSSQNPHTKQIWWYTSMVPALVWEVEIGETPGILLANQPRTYISMCSNNETPWPREKERTSFLKVVFCARVCMPTLIHTLKISHTFYKLYKIFLVNIFTRLMMLNLLNIRCYFSFILIDSCFETGFSV